jgi:hypothetical protein
LARLFLDTRIEKVQRIRTPYFRLAPDGSAEVDCPPPRAVPDDPPLWGKVRPGWFDLGRLGEMRLFVAHLDRLRLPQCFIFLPMHPGFRRKYLDDFGTEHAKWKAAVTEVYGGRVIDLEDALQDPKYYRDASHLNGEGAILLSQILKDRIETEGPIRPPRAALDPCRSAGGAPQ